MSEVAPFIFAYGFIAMAAVIGLGLSAIDTHEQHHWTRPFAGFLWPILAIIAIWIVWGNRNDK